MPNSQKNTQQKVHEKRTDYVDKFAKHTEPESHKGPLQKISDGLSTEKKNAHHDNSYHNSGRRNDGYVGDNRY